MATTDARADAGPSRATLAQDLLAAEWIKMRSVRSTYWTLLASAVLAIFVSGIIAGHWASDWNTMPAEARASFDPLADSFRGFQIAQLIVGALGVLVIGGEYGSGLIRTTFAAYARRRSVLAAKAAVLGAVALVFGEVLAFASFWVTQAILSSANGLDLGLSIGSPGALRGTVAAGAYLAVAGLLGVAFGFLLRHTAAALSALFALLFVIPPIVSSLPSPWGTDIGKFLPTGAVSQLATAHPAATGLSQPWAVVMLVVWPAVALAAAAVMVTRRDA